MIDCYFQKKEINTPVGLIYRQNLPCLEASFLTPKNNKIFIDKTMIFVDVMVIFLH
jgi:hypothetical protein